MADISGLLGVKGATTPKNSTSRKGNTELNMQDFLQLMVVQLTSQTIDDTMDTSEMMNQLVQMQMISAITNLTESSVMSYASSLVGKVVTVGVVSGDSLEEREIAVMGTGTYDGQQVIFGSDGEMYRLSQIMAVGRLPNEDGTYGPKVPGEGEETEKPPVEGAEGSGAATENPNPAESGEVTPPTGTEGAGENQNPEYDGGSGAPAN